MHITWKSLGDESSKWLRSAAIGAAGLAALYVGAIHPLRIAESARQQRATGLAWEPVSLPHQTSLPDFIAGTPRRASAGVAESAELVSDKEGAGLSATIPAITSPIAEERKITRTDALDLVVKSPGDSADKIRQLAEGVGGFLETSQVSGERDATTASLTIRVPAAGFEEVRAEIRKLGLRVESEKVDAQDVTKQYVDQEARLRNLHAEEAQYLAILKHASTVSDTLEVSQKLDDVRGEIEQQQAEFEALSKQVETVAIAISLRAETDTQVFGLHWRPLYQLKAALHDGLNGLADYASTMASVLFYLPAVLLWMATILLGLAVAYRILRWAGRALFPRTQRIPAKV